MAAAVRTWGLAKSFGATLALRPLDLEVAEVGTATPTTGPGRPGQSRALVRLTLRKLARCGEELVSAERAVLMATDQVLFIVFDADALQRGVRDGSVDRVVDFAMLTSLHAIEIR